MLERNCLHAAGRPVKGQGLPWGTLTGSSDPTKLVMGDAWSQGIAVIQEAATVDGGNEFLRQPSRNSRAECGRLPTGRDRLLEQLSTMKMATVYI